MPPVYSPLWCSSFRNRPVSTRLSYSGIGPPWLTAGSASTTVAIDRALLEQDVESLASRTAVSGRCTRKHVVANLSVRGVALVRSVPAYNLPPTSVLGARRWRSEALHLAPECIMVVNVLGNIDCCIGGWEGGLRSVFIRFQQVRKWKWWR